jgi:hypothetical protein
MVPRARFGRKSKNNESGRHQPAIKQVIVAEGTELPSTACLRPDFIWGVSTSSFQIEGATKKMAAARVSGMSIVKPKIKNHDTGDVARPLPSLPRMSR